MGEVRRGLDDVHSLAGGHALLAPDNALVGGDVAEAGPCSGRGPGARRPVAPLAAKHLLPPAHFRRDAVHGRLLQPLPPRGARAAARSLHGRRPRRGGLHVRGRGRVPAVRARPPRGAKEVAGLGDELTQLAAQAASALAARGERRPAPRGECQHEHHQEARHLHGDSTVTL